MPRRIRDYLDRLSHRDTHREEPNTYTVNTTVNLRDWQPVRWNATQWFPDNDTGETTRQMLENTYNNMTVQDYEELASRNFNDYVVPENMLRLVRLSMPNITRNTLVEERPMDPPDPPRYGLYSRYIDDDDASMYREYTPTWSNKTISWAWGDQRSGHVEFRRGRIIRVKRYCKI